MAKVNIIIRTLNEGKWLDLCLRMIMRQTFKDFDVTIVDSGSLDLTIDICNKYKTKILNIENYLPGKAINYGILSKPNSEYAVILSAHCIPIGVDWLNKLVSFMEINKNIAGAYGNQLPMNFTCFDNIRDLAVTFRGDTSIRNDGFFHNANSIIRISAWREFKFNEETLHIEDILWAQTIQKTNYDIAYIQEAQVTHHHGTNHHSNYESFRSKRVAEIIQMKGLTKQYSIEDLFALSDIPIVNIYRENFLTEHEKDPFGIILEEVPNYSKELSISEVIKIVNNYVFHSFPSAIGVCFYPSAHKNFADIISRLKKIFYKNFPDAVIPVTEDRGNYWIESQDGFHSIQSNLLHSSNKNKIYKERLLFGGIVQLNALANGKPYIENPLMEKILLENV